MVDRVLLIMEFGVELIRILFGMTVIFGAKLRKVWAVVIIYGIFIGVTLIESMDIHVLGLVMWLLVIVLYVITIEFMPSKNRKSKLYCGFILFYMEEFICIVMDDIVYFFFDEFIDFQIKELLNSIVSLITVCLIGIIYRVRAEQIKKQMVSVNFRRCMIPMVVFVAIELIAVVGCLSFVVRNDGDGRQQLVVSILNILSMVGIGILFALVSYVKNTNDEIEHKLIMEKQLKNLEAQYYGALLEKEEKTRRYRHDMNGHLICLDELISTGDMGEAKQYIEKMLDHMNEIRKSGFNTGNKVLDILLKYYADQLDEDVVVSIKGKCKETIDVSDIDICTIFSNLLKNAVEAIRVCDMPDRYLAITVEEGNRFVKVMISNSMKSVLLDIDKEGNIHTTKKDKMNHGMGILNVKETVQANAGRLEYNAQDNQFCCKVFLPIRQNISR